MTPHLRLKVALAFAEAGYKTFPVEQDSKKEFWNGIGSKFGRQFATTDAATIQRWANSTDPHLQDCNFKAIVPDGACVIDIEPTPAADGELYDWLLENGVFEPSGLGNPTVDGGYHYFQFGLPDGLKIERGNFWLVPSKVEVRGPGIDILLPESVVDGVKYALIKGNATEVSKFVLDAIYAHNEGITGQIAERLRLKAEKTIESRLNSDITNADRAYVQAALTNNIKTLKDAAKGTRNTSLYKASWVMGTYTHIVSSAEIKAAILEALNDWEDLPKVEKTLDSGLERGAKFPKTPPGANGRIYRRQSLPALAAIEAELDQVRWGGKFAGTKGNVMGTSVHDALKSIVKRGMEVGSLDVVASVRWVAENAQMSTSTSFKTLQVAQELGLLGVSRNGNPASGEANIYHLTASGFNALCQMRRAETSKSWTKTIQVLVSEREVLGSSYGNAEGEVSLSLTTTCIDFVQSKRFQDASDVGIFQRVGVGRSGRLVLEYLATEPMTIEHLTATTGFCKKTVERVVDKLEHFGFIATSGDVQTFNPIGFDEAVSKVESAGKTKDVKRLRGIKIKLAQDGYKTARKKIVAEHKARDEERDRRVAEYDDEWNSMSREDKFRGLVDADGVFVG